MQRGLAILSLLALVLAGCAGGDGKDETGGDEQTSALDPITRVQDRRDLEFITDAGNHSWSQVLQPGPFDILEGVGQTITIDIPTGQGLPTADVHMGLFFPDVEGCDWQALMDVDPAREAQMLPYPVGMNATDPCRLPVVADAGPYWGEPVLGDVHAESRGSGRLGEFLISNLVPHGYIVAQLSVTGTGDATGCMDLMGEIEQAGVQEAVRYLGDAGFSNGAVALTGRSYDGSTPWEAAMAADLPQLKTVVPISGLYGQYDLMWKNGSAETRGPGVLWGLYYAFTYTGNDPLTPAAQVDVPPIDPGRINDDPETALLQARQIAENLVCAETQAGGAYAASTYLFGQGPAEMATDEGTYWEERSFGAEVLENYEGSVYFIHGMQDWNVDPHMAFPFYNELEAKGLEMKGLFGQWAHNYPDRVSEHPDNIRWDWAQDMLEWFDHYLKGTGEKPQLHVEMEDDSNRWRVEETWPPKDVAWTTVAVEGGDAAMTGDCASSVDGQAAVGPTCSLLFDLGTLDEHNDSLIAGLPRFHVDVTPQGPGGQIYAELRDATDDRRIGHAIMDLRYHEGGTEMQTVTPGVTITAKMEFFPLDARVPAGHDVQLIVANTGQDYLESSVSTPTVVEQGDLKLPTIDRAADDYFLPPGWQPYE